MELISHYHHKDENFYSLHSWLGLLSITIFACQFIFGFLCYFSPFSMEKIKAFYMPIHVFFGCSCFVLSVATSLIGLNESASFNENYSQITSEGVMINTIGILMVLFGGLVIFLATKGSYKYEKEKENLK